MKTMLHIGVSKETVVEAKKAILEILKSPGAEQKTKRLALKTFSDAVSVNNATIKDCTFNDNSK